MLASLLGALWCASSFPPDLAAYQASLSPISFDPTPRCESYVAVDSVFSSGSWSEVAGSRVQQTVLASDAAGRPTEVKLVASAGGVMDTSVRTQAWINSQVLESMSTTFSYGGIPLSLALSSTTSGSRVDQALAVGSLLFKANVAARDTLELNAAGRPQSLTLRSLDTAGMVSRLLNATALSLQPSLRSVTAYASDTLPQARALQAWTSGAWKPVDSSRVELLAGVPAILHHADSAGTTRDSLVWKEGRLSERLRTDEVTTFSYDASGRVLRRLTSRLSAGSRTPVSSTTYAYDAAAGLVRQARSGLLSISASGPNRTALLRLERSTVVRVSVHSVDGRLLGLLADGQLPAGTSSFSLNGIRGAAIVKVSGSGLSATATIPNP